MLRPTLPTAVALTVCAILAAPLAAENTNIAEVRPEAVIPIMSKAPTIDGTIGEGEWDTLHVGRFVSQRGDVLQPRYGEFWIGSDGESIYFGVRSAVHPMAGVLAKEEPVRGSKDVGRVVMDDSIELWVDNNPGGEEGQYYQLLVNSKGAVMDKMHDRAQKVGHLWWRKPLRQAHTVTDGVWTAEFAYKLADLGIDDPSTPIGVRVCRNFKYPWDQSRWAPNVISFDSPETMGRVSFVERAPVVKELGFQDDEGINVAVEVANPTDAPLGVKVRLGQNPENQPRYYKDWDLKLAPGERKKLEYRSKLFSPENYPAVGEILVTDPDGKVYYHRDFRWNTQPGDAWAKIESKRAEEVTSFDIEWHPTPKLLRWRTGFDKYADRKDVTAVRVVVIDAESGAPVATETVTDVDKFKVERRTKLADLPDGRFEVRLYLDAGEPAAEPIKTAVFHHASDFAWLDNDIGVSDEVIPPFTPLKVADGTVSAVLREHEMTDAGLWAQVVAKGKPLLSGPMRLDVTRGGETRSAEGELTFTEKRPNRVVAKATWTAGPVKGETVSEFDYDGCMKVTLRFEQSDDEPLDAMELVIPLKDSAARLMHSCGDGLRINYAGSVPEGDGVVWTSKRASRVDLLGTFLPYLWVGGVERGVCWFAANDRDWVTDLDENVPAVSMERSGDALAIRVRLVQKPATLDRTHEVVFGLMATPAKPMPAEPNWRTWTCGAGGGGYRTSILGMCMYWGAYTYGVFPLKRDYTVVRKIVDVAKKGVYDEEWFEDYYETHPQFKAEVRWSANQRGVNAIIPYTNIRGALTYPLEYVVYQNEWRRDNFPGRQTDLERERGAVDFTIVPTPSRIDFLLYYYREFMRNGFDGIYWDNICIYSNRNRVTSDGYVRADGMFQPAGDIWRIREVTKRTAVLSHQMGKVNCNVPHMTNALLAPVFSWTGMMLGWEWKYGGADFQDRWTRDYIQAVDLGLQVGNVPLMLGGIRDVKSPEARDWCTRTRAGVCLAHELRVWHPDKLLLALRRELWDRGYGTDAMRVHHYFDDEPVAKVEGVESAWAVYDTDESTVVVVTDWGDGGDAAVTLDAERLGLPADAEAVNMEDAEDTLPVADGRFTIPALKKHDFRMLEIAK